MDKKKSFDVLIVGAGPAGYSSALALAPKYNVGIVECEAIGGVCLNCGCIPTKFLLHKAKENLIQDSNICNEKLEKWKKEKEQLICNIRRNMEATLQNKNIEIIYGKACAIRKGDELIDVVVGENVYRAKWVVSAVGSKEIVPPIEGVEFGIEAGYVLDSKRLLDNSEKISRLAIVGGGVIGLEFASFWNMLGSEVTILEKETDILSELDDDVRAIVLRSMKRKGIEIITSAVVEEIDCEEQCVIYRHEEKRKIIECDKVLLATGRKSRVLTDAMWHAEKENVVGFGDIEEIRSMFERSIIYVGDANNKLMLAHTAYEESKVLKNIFQGKNDSVKYELVPKVVYSNPEMAWVGLNEKGCIEKNIEYYSCKKSMSYSGKYLIENISEPGCCKLIFEKKSEKIIGAQLVGNGSSEMIAFLKLAIEKEMTQIELQRFTFPHPSVSEIIYETLT